MSDWIRCSERLPEATVGAVGEEPIISDDVLVLFETGPDIANYDRYQNTRKASGYRCEPTTQNNPLGNPHHSACAVAHEDHRGGAGGSGEQMRKPPFIYRDREFRPSFQAGYRAGFEGRPDRSRLRGADVKEAYRAGLKAGRKDQRRLAKARQVAA
jgi:hypothetical protein